MLALLIARRPLTAPVLAVLIWVLAADAAIACLLTHKVLDRLVPRQRITVRPCFAGIVESHCH